MAMKLEMMPHCNFGDTTVYVENDMVEKVPIYLSKILSEGVICFLYDEMSENFALKLSSRVKSAGYRLCLMKISEDNIKINVPEYVRYVFGVGGGFVCDIVKEVSLALSLESGFMFTQPSTDSILQGNAPKTVFIDPNELINCPNEQIASGWGYVMSEQLRRFEDYFSEKILSSNVSTDSDKFSMENVQIGMSNEILAVKLLQIGYAKNQDDTADIMAKVLFDMQKRKGGKTRLLGEYKYLCSSLLIVFYLNFLSAPALDIMPPASHELMCKSLLNFAGQNYEKIVKRIDFFVTKSYFRLSFILSEYRLDLLDKLRNLDFHSLNRKWRRLYSDAGFWIKEEVTARDMLIALALSSEICTGLLSFANVSGVTQNYLKIPVSA